MSEEKINFRGVNDGIYLVIEGKNFDNIIKALDSKIKGRTEFYKGAKLLAVKSDSLSNSEKLDLTYRLKYKYGFELGEESLLDLIKEDGFENTDEIKEVFNNCNTKFVNGTIRSGQLIEHDGSIVIIGDVNPGAVIHAKYNIIVLGSFRGVGYAGEGDNRSVVAAYKLNPTQLKIADTMARSPDNKGLEGHKQSLPEVARIINDELVIEPYLPNK